MTDPFNRRMIIAPLALLPTFLFVLASQAFTPPPPPNARDLVAAEIAALPGGPAEAPLLTGAMAAPTMSADAMEQARASNLADPFFTGPIQPAVPFRFAGSCGTQAKPPTWVSILMTKPRQRRFRVQRHRRQLPSSRC